MKALVWIACIVVYSTITVGLSMAGISLGGLPTLFLAVVLVYIPAKSICEAIDKKKAPDEPSAARQEQSPNAPVTTPQASGLTKVQPPTLNEDQPPVLGEAPAIPPEASEEDILGKVHRLEDTMDKALAALREEQAKQQKLRRRCNLLGGACLFLLMIVVASLWSSPQPDTPTIATQPALSVTPSTNVVPTPPSSISEATAPAQSNWSKLQEWAQTPTTEKDKLAAWLEAHASSTPTSPPQEQKSIEERLDDLRQAGSAPTPTPTSNTPNLDRLRETDFMTGGTKATLAPTSAPSPQPVTIYSGKILEYPVSERLAPFGVETTGTGGYYIVLAPNDGTAENKMSFYASAGKHEEVNVPLGEYEVYYACGETWYGQDLLFGDDTAYYKCDGTFEFYDDGEFYQGWTLSLYPQRNGNMDTDLIDIEDFPK